MDGSEFPEQFSPETRAALLRAVDELTAALHAHAERLAGMAGGSRDVAAVFAAHDQVAAVLDAWNERVFDHTGTFPLALAADEDDEDDEDDDEPQEPADGDPITVTSRWDLRVVDTAALLGAGRDAHRRMSPGADDEDAAAPVPHPGLALHALLQEHGERRYDLPGLEVLHGAPSYVRHAGPAGGPDEDDDLAPIAQPPGERLFGESWH